MKQWRRFLRLQMKCCSFLWHIVENQYFYEFSTVFAFQQVLGLYSVTTQQDHDLEY
jgi:hypothetical protein